MQTSVSLLERLRTVPDEAAWQRLDDLYRPLIRGWLLRDPTLRDEADDLVQEVMAVLIRELPSFERQRTGSFRRWLPEVTVHRLQAFWRARSRRAARLDGMATSSLMELADPNSELSRLWDAEHNRHVVDRLLELLAAEFEPETLRAFRRVVLDDVKPAQAATELGTSVNAILLAKSRVLSRLRQEAEGLMD